MQKADPYIERGFVYFGRDMIVKHRVAEAEHGIDLVERRAGRAAAENEIPVADKLIVAAVIGFPRSRLEEKQINLSARS